MVPKTPTNKHVTKAIVAGGLEAAGIGAVLKTYLDYSDAQDRYVKATKITDIRKYREERDDLHKRWSVASIAAGAIFLVSAAEACWDAWEYQRNRLPE